ncbi:unnamed protein product [Caenorhabditis brenneri]
MSTRLILFFALLSVTLAAHFKMPLKKSANLREKMIREGRYKQFLESRKAQELETGDQPLFDVYDEYYLAVIYLGSSEQQFDVALDTTSSNLWVLDVNCVSKGCKGVPMTGTLKNTYNSSKSVTYYSDGTSFSVPYKGGFVSGVMGTDQLLLGDFHWYEQDFGSATVVPEIYTQEPVDGILGLGFPAFAIPGTNTTIQRLMPMLDAPLITIWMELTDGTAKEFGYATYGMFDTKECSENILYVPLKDNTTWKFYVDAFQIGSYSRVKNEIALSATGSGWTGVPNVVLSGIVKQTKAVYDFTNGIYTVPCSRNQPDILLAINGVPYTIRSRNYVIDINLKNGQCALAFFGTTTQDPAWILGDAFVRSYCHVLDYGNARIGFAQSRQDF